MDSIVTTTRTNERTYALPAALVRRDPARRGVLFDLRSYAGMTVRLSGRESGYALERIVGRTTEPLEDDVRLDFLSEAAARDPRSPLAPFTEAIPGEAARYVTKLEGLQLQAFRLLSLCPAALDLLRASPRVLWLLIGVSFARRTPLPEIHEVLRKRRHEILGWCGGMVTKAAVRYAERRQVCRYDAETFAALITECASATVVRDTLHVPAPDEESAFLSLEHPELLWSALARKVIDPRARTISPRHLWMLWRDALRMTEESEREAMVRRLSSACTAERVQEIHDDVLLAYYARTAPDRKDKPLPPPPFAGTPEIQPLSSIRALEIEGKSMRHCVASYATEVRCRRSYIYRVLAPERATLEIDISGPEPFVAQLKLSCNRQPRKETFDAVEAWLARRLEERRRAQSVS